MLVTLVRGVEAVMILAMAVALLVGLIQLIARHVNVTILFYRKTDGEYKKVFEIGSRLNVDIKIG